MFYWLALIILVTGMMLGLQNAAAVAVALGPWTLELPLAVALLAMLALGMLAGWFLHALKHLLRRTS